MYFGNALVIQEKYIRENNYRKMYGINLCCCVLDFYKNETNYLQHFICYLYKC